MSLQDSSVSIPPVLWLQVQAADTTVFCKYWLTKLRSTWMCSKIFIHLPFPSAPTINLYKTGRTWGIDSYMYKQVFVSRMGLMGLEVTVDAAWLHAPPSVSPAKWWFIPQSVSQKKNLHFFSCLGQYCSCRSSIKACDGHSHFQLHWIRPCHKCFLLHITDMSYPLPPFKDLIVEAEGMAHSKEHYWYTQKELE